MVNRIEEVTIVGGGTAGWITALSLTTLLNARREGPGIRVTLVESPNIPRIGVGESTVLEMRNLVRKLGLDEAEFIRRCNVSFKLAARFVNWSVGNSGEFIDYFNPFSTYRYVGRKDPTYHFHKFGLPDDCVDFEDSLVPVGAIIRQLRGPRRLGGKQFQSQTGYSYHLDAALFADYLRDVSLGRGIRHILDDVVDVQQDERGFVSHLQLKQGGPHPVQFVVDCSGFKSLIIQKVLGEPFVPFGQHLLCDRALAVQIPHVNPTRIEPCTRATALGAGWVWRVPLYNRLGTGYVYSSAFRTEQQALDEFRAHLGDQAGEIEPLSLSMRIGRMRRSWVKNCVAIGLSGGFVEPLEATAIFITSVSAGWLARLFPDKAVNPVRAKRFNLHMEQLYDEVRDFIVMHYYTSNRPEPFWRAARSEIELPDSLRENLELWRHALPTKQDIPKNVLFGHVSYIYALYAKGYFQDVSFPMEGSISRRDWDIFSKQLRTLKDGLLRTLPDHYELLTHIRQSVGDGGPDPVGKRSTASPGADSVAPSPMPVHD